MEMPASRAALIGRMGVLRLAFVLLAVGALPAVLAFTTESGSQPCLAIRDGWQAEWPPSPPRTTPAR